MKTSLRRFLAFTVTCIVGYIAAGKDSVGTTISDTCFLVGIACLIAGLWSLVARTGFFFIARYSMGRFLSLVMNKKLSSEPIGESYQKHLRSFDSARAYYTPLYIAAAMLIVSAAFALL